MSTLGDSRRHHQRCWLQTNRALGFLFCSRRGIEDFNHVLPVNDRMWLHQVLEVVRLILFTGRSDYKPEGSLHIFLLIKYGSIRVLWMSATSLGRRCIILLVVVGGILVGEVNQMVETLPLDHCLRTTSLVVWLRIELFCSQLVHVEVLLLLMFGTPILLLAPII